MQQAWERDLNVSLSPAQWEVLWRTAVYASKCVQFRIIQNKIMCRSWLVCLKLMKRVTTSVGTVVTPVAHYLIYSGNVQMFFLSGPWLYP